MPHGTRLQEGLGLLVEPFAILAVKRCFLQDAESRLGPEVVFVVEAVHRLKNLGRGQSRVLNMGELVTALIHHLAL